MFVEKKLANCNVLIMASNKQIKFNELFLKEIKRDMQTNSTSIQRDFSEKSSVNPHVREIIAIPPPHKVTNNLIKL